MKYNSCFELIDKNSLSFEYNDYLASENINTSTNTNTNTYCDVILFTNSDSDKVEQIMSVLAKRGIQPYLCRTYKDVYRCLKTHKCSALLFDTMSDDVDITVSEKAMSHILSDFPWLRIVALVPADQLCNENLRRLSAEGWLYDFHSFPVDEDRLIYCLGHIQGLVELEKNSVSVAGKALVGYGDIIGACPRMQRVYDVIRRVSRISTPVLITGESGTGKELAAKAIHDRSAYKSGNFVAINCAALPPNLIESELFGYEPGAFTGASRRKPGRIEEANGGTLFLDEIGDMPLELQPHFLRFLQDGLFKRVGGTKTLQIKTRVIAATNVDLKEAIDGSTFREDLYYRLNVVTINMPPLGERGQDIELLARYFLTKYCREYDRPNMRFSRNAMIYLLNHGWPGNVRELASAVGRAVVMANGNMIRPTDFQMDADDEHVVDQRQHMTLAEAREAYDRKFITGQLVRNKHNIQRTSKELGISRVALYRLIKRYDISRMEIDGVMSGVKTLILVSALLLGGLMGGENAFAQQENGDLKAMRQALEAQAARLDRQAAELEQQRRELDEQRRQLMELVRQQAGAGAPKASTAATPGQSSATSSATAAAASPSSPPEDAATQPPRETRPEQEITVIADVGGVLTPKGMLTFEPSISASHTSSNRFFFQGVEIVDAVLIGAIEATESRRNYLSAQMGFRYGLTNRMEVSAKVPFIYRNDRVESTIISEAQGSQGEPTFLQDLDATGLGDIEFGAQYQINSGQRGWPYFIANLRAKSDTGKGPFDVKRNPQGLELELPTGAGFWSVEPSVTMILQSDPGVFFANLGYIWNIGRDVNLQTGGSFIGHVNPGDTISASMGVGFALNETLSMSFGYQHNYIFGTDSQVNNSVVSGNDFQVGSLLFGMSLGLGRMAGLSMNVAVGVTDDSPDVEFSLRMPFSVMLSE